MAFIWTISLALLVVHCTESHGRELASNLFDKAIGNDEPTDLAQNDFPDEISNDVTGEVGITFTRWGRDSCPTTSGTTLVYEGYVGGSYYLHTGGASNYVCLPRNPIYASYKSGFQDSRSEIYGAEYQTESDGIFPSSLYQHDVPCAVCHVSGRASQIMIPARDVCPTGWTREYRGYLMAAKGVHYRTMYTCVDKYPDFIAGSIANQNGALFYFVEGRCGSLPCQPYVDGRELTCAVCTR